MRLTLWDRGKGDYSDYSSELKQSGTQRRALHGWKLAFEPTCLTFSENGLARSMACGVLKSICELPSCSAWPGFVP